MPVGTPLASLLRVQGSDLIKNKYAVSGFQNKSTKAAWMGLGNKMFMVWDLDSCTQHNVCKLYNLTSHTHTTHNILKRSQCLKNKSMLTFHTGQEPLSPG